MGPPSEMMITEGKLTQTIPMPNDSVSLLLLTAKPESVPPKIEGVTLDVVTPKRSAISDVMVMWKGSPARTIKTYEVLFSKTEAGPFERINKTDTITSAFAHVGVGTGFYRVRAVDFWNRTSEDSVAVSSAQQPRDKTQR